LKKLFYIIGIDLKPGLTVENIPILFPDSPIEVIGTQEQDQHLEKEEDFPVVVGHDRYEQIQKPGSGFRQVIEHGHNVTLIFFKIFDQNQHLVGLQQLIEKKLTEKKQFDEEQIFPEVETSQDGESLSHRQKERHMDALSDVVFDEDIGRTADKKRHEENEHKEGLGLTGQIELRSQVIVAVRIVYIQSLPILY